MTPLRAVPSLWSLFLLFLIGSVSAQYTTAKDGDICYDPSSTETSTQKYSNSTASATGTIKPTTISGPSTTGAPPAASSPGSAGSAIAPELVLGLIAALVAVRAPVWEQLGWSDTC